jgi:hypothetical protein
MRGTSLVEAMLVLGILGALVLFGVSQLSFGSPGLSAVQGELRGALEQSLLRARAQGCDLRVALQGQGDLTPLTLPRGVHWGLPATGVPLPPGMAPTVRAHLTGQAHSVVTVTPETAQASAWFLHDGQDALCLRLSDRGRLQLLRWRHQQQRWTRL